MCPLRVILIFLSATIAGFFLLRGGLNSQPDFDFNHDQQDQQQQQPDEHKNKPLSSKVGSAICGGFWTLVDMASGRYLWRTIVSPARSSEKEQ